ncbi:MAG: GAF domain-containing protein, partial [Thermodesulfobacteriota bacterium]
MTFSRPMEGQPLREVFQGMSATLLDLFDVDHATITLLDEGRRFFIVEAEYPQLSKPLVGEPIPIQDRASQHSLVSRQESIVVHDLNDHVLMSESPSFRQIVQDLDIRSVLIVPMVTDGKAIGTISLDTIGRTKLFSKEEVELCQTVANQVAAFVAITRLIEEQQKYRRQAGLVAPVPRRTVLSDREEKSSQTIFGDLAKGVHYTFIPDENHSWRSWQGSILREILHGTPHLGLTFKPSAVEPCRARRQGMEQPLG